MACNGGCGGMGHYGENAGHVHAPAVETGNGSSGREREVRCVCLKPLAWLYGPICWLCQKSSAIPRAHQSHLIRRSATSATARKQSPIKQHQQHQPSLFRDPTVPPLARWGVPLLLLANDLLLFVSNFGEGATVHLKVFEGLQPNGQGRSVESAPLYTITLGRSIQDMWNARAYFTSVLIAGACVTLSARRPSH